MKEILKIINDKGDKQDAIKAKIAKAKSSSDVMSQKDRQGSVRSVKDDATEKSGFQSLWAKPVRKVMETPEDVSLILSKVRELVPYPMAYKAAKMMASFKKKYQEEWETVEG